MALKMKKTGGNPIIVSITEFPKFMDAVQNVPVDSLKKVPEDELKSQFRSYLEKLKALTDDIDDT